MKNEFRIAVLAGDGIGPEITEPSLRILERVVQRVGGFTLTYDHLEAGAAAYLKRGAALPEETLERSMSADAILLAAMGDPNVRYPDGTELVPQIELREKLQLFAGIRPVRSVQGAPAPLADSRGQRLDFVIIRESTEGLFAARVNGEIEEDRVARDTMVITRENCERLFEFSFDLTRKRKARGYPGVLTCVDKANVLPSMAFYRKIFEECAARNTDIEAQYAYVDATALNMVRSPWKFDVLVMENMYGDILSDLGAGLIGGMGMAPSADIGRDHAVFQPCHGSAPDIAGTGKANPTAMILSTAMMLDWLGEKYANTSCVKAGQKIYDAVDGAFAEGKMISCEFGGHSGTQEIVEAVLRKLD